MTAPSIPRKQAADLLAGILPAGVRVIPHARNTPAPDRQTVMLRFDEVAVHPQAPESHRLYTFTGIVITPMVDPTGPADDDLDDLLEQVLFALDESPHLSWSRAVRGTWLDTTAPCWEITVTSATPKPQETP